MPIQRPVLTRVVEVGTRDGTSTRSTLAIGEVSVTRTVSVLWGEAHLAAQHYLGYSRIANGRLERLLPAAHPDDTTLICTRVSLVGNHKFVGKRGQRKPVYAPLSDQSIGSAYDKAILELSYERPMYKLLEDHECPSDQEYLRYVDWGDSPQPTEEVFTMPGHTLNFIAQFGTPFGGSATLPVGYNVPKIFPMIDFQVTWKRLPAEIFDVYFPGPWLLRMVGNPNNPSMVPYQGIVNKTPFLTFPAGTLLLKSWRPIRKPAPFTLFNTPFPGGPMTWASPSVEWDIEFTFRYDPKGHNTKFYVDPVPPGGSRSNAGNSGLYFVGAGTTWYPPGNVPDRYSLFNEREFADLFVVT